MRTLVNGADLYYEERGSGPPLLLIHGNGAYADLWSPVLDALARSFRVIAYDRRGFGRSPSAKRWSLPDHARDAAALLETLGASPATVVGWSAGGVVALDLAASFPARVSGLVLAEPAVHLLVHPTRSSLAMAARSAGQRYMERDRAEAAATMYRWAGGYKTGGNAFDGFPEAWQQQMLGHAPSTLREMDQLMRPYPSRVRIRSITCPVSVLEGELSDPTFALADAFVMRLLPQARRISLPGAGHFLHIDQPDRWVEAVLYASRAPTSPRPLRAASTPGKTQTAPGRVYFKSYARLHATVSTRLLYPRSERAGLRAQRQRLLRDAHGSTMELVGAFIGVNLPAYPADLDELVLALQHPHMARRLRREVVVSGRRAEIVECSDGRLPFPDNRFDTVVATLSLCLPTDVNTVLDETARVLKPEGRLLFIEHVRSDQPGLARWQDRLAPAWRYLAIGCNCNRDTVHAIEQSGFRVESVEHGVLPKLGPLVRPLVTGVAVPIG